MNIHRHLVERIQVLSVLFVLDDLATVCFYLLLLVLASRFSDKALPLAVPSSGRNSESRFVKWRVKSTRRLIKMLDVMIPFHDAVVLVELVSLVSHEVQDR